MAGEDIDPDARIIDEIYEALDRGAPERALARARHTMESAVEDDPVIHFLAGLALLELERPAEARTELERAVELDPEDAEFRARLALASFRCCRFDEAERQAQLAVEADAKLPESHWVQALVLERRGRWEDADRGFARAAELDPEGYPIPARMDRESFERHLADAMDRLPETFRKHLDRVAVTVEELPAEPILLEEHPPLDPEQLLGLFVGVPHGEEGAFVSGQLPPRILLFKRNLERLVLDGDELEEEIAVTLYHELGHYLGLDEQELADIDLT